jgi:hypothetical protein
MKRTIAIGLLAASLICTPVKAQPFESCTLEYASRSDLTMNDPCVVQAVD